MGAIERAMPFVAAAIVLWSDGAFSQARASAGVALHADTDRLTVIHPHASVRAPIGEDTRISARWEADVITAATIDVRTSASPAGFEETRHGIGAGIEHDLSRTTTVVATASVDLSPDYDSGALTLAAGWEDDSRARRFGLSTTLASSRVGRAGDRHAAGWLRSSGVSATYAALLSSEAVLDGAVGLDQQSGYLESPYRFVPIESAVGPSWQVHLVESVPDTRLRLGGRVRLRWSVTRAWVLRSSLRAHGDSWGVLGATIEIESWVRLAPALRWIVGTRLHGQRGAGFYRATYYTLPELPRWRTLDRELAPGWQTSASTGAELDVGHVGGALLRVGVRAEGTWVRYVDTPRLPERLMLTAAATVSVEQ